MLKGCYFCVSLHVGLSSKDEHFEPVVRICCKCVEVKGAERQQRKKVLHRWLDIEAMILGRKELKLDKFAQGFAPFNERNGAALVVGVGGVQWNAHMMVDGCRDVAGRNCALGDIASVAG